MAPGQFGVAKEDIHCRCTMLTRARSALDEEELKTLKERAEYLRLDKVKDFGEFKSKYLENGKYFKNISGIMFDVEMRRDFGIDVKVPAELNWTDDSIEDEIAKTIKGSINKVLNKFPKIKTEKTLAGIEIIEHKNLDIAGYDPTNKKLFFNPKKFDIEEMARMAKINEKKGIWTTNNKNHIIYHELGHSIEEAYINEEKIKLLKELHIQEHNKILGRDFEYIIPKSLNDLPKEKLEATRDSGFSYYGLQDYSEMIAESMAEYLSGGEISYIAKEVIKILLGG